MILLMLKMAVYIFVSVIFGFIAGKMYANAKNSEDNLEKDDKYNKIISDKNGIIIRQKNSLRSLQRKVDSASQGYELQQKFNHKLEIKLEKLEDENREVLHLQNENRELSNKLSSKIKLVDEKEQVINLLEKRANEVST